MISFLFLSAMVWPACGQETWPPRLPNLSSAQTQAIESSPAGRPLESMVVEQGFDLIAAKNINGAGREAVGARAWIEGKEKVLLDNENSGWKLVSGTESLALSEVLGKILSRMNQYFVMKPAAAAELKTAILSPGGVAKIQALFEESIAQRLEFNDKIVLPEIGGEATLGVEPDFHRMNDPFRPLLLEVAKFRENPKELSRLFKKNPEGMSGVDSHGTLKLLLDRWPSWESKDSPPKEKREEILRQAVNTVLETSAHSYSHSPDQQILAIANDEWSGRYIGIWHIHPPDFTRHGWQAGEPPSDNDREIAAQDGQNLTIAFHPEGFDVYDLSAKDISNAQAISYRDARWRVYFQDIHAKLFQKP